MQRWMGIAAVAAVLAGGGEAAAQREHRSETTHIITDDDGRRMERRFSGEIEVRPDGRAVARMGTGARLSIEEARPGQPERRMELRPDGDGRVRTLYFERGERVDPDAGDRAWMERMIVDAVRENGLGAEQRIRHIRRTQGADGVLREIERIENDGDKRHYYRMLMASGTSADERARMLRHLGRHVRSDGEKRAALASVLDRPSLSAAELTAMLDAAATIDSDGEAASLLARVAREEPLEDARVREAFFRAASTLGSDGELARVLTAVLRRPETRDDVVRAAIRATEQIDSDGERARVLVAVPDRSLRSSAVRAAVRDALEEMDSEGERQRVERRLARVQS